MSPAGQGSGAGGDEFVAEATEILESLGRDLLALDAARDQEPDPDLLNGIFRAAHSLKGSAGMFGHTRIAHLAHAAEDLLDALRLGKVEASGAVVDALVEALDALQALIAEAAAPDGGSDEATRRAEVVAGRLRGLWHEEPAHADDPLDRLALSPEVRNVFTEYEEHRLRENVKKGVALWRIRAVYSLDDFDQGLAALNARLKPQGEIVSTLPSSQPGAEAAIAFDLLFATRKGEAALREAIAGTVAEAEPIPVRPAAVAPPVQKGGARPARARGKGKRGAAPAATGPKVVREAREGDAPALRFEPEQTLRSPTQTVRVDIRRLDELMNAVGELILIKSNLQRLVEAARQGAPGAPGRMWTQELARETRALERKLDGVQDGLLGARMVPLSQVFDKLARLIRRIAREAGKEIDLVVSGGEVELDKLIVEELSDPLMHLIRNAIDHGVEPPQVRVQKGKPRRATVALRAVQRGNHVVIAVSDDGAGIDEQRVRQVAVGRGLIDEQQARELAGRELLNLIFAPGFSTARAVSELSGRGVGLDVVKTNIARLSGLIDVRSEPGRGATFEITLPVTLAIIRALVVAVSGRTYAIPLSTVVEILSVLPRDVRRVERREMLDVRGRTLPLVRLARLFGHPEPPADRRLFAVVAGLAQDRICLGVDELSGQQDIVIKPLGGRLAKVPGIAGATDLGNRQTVLVLDVGALIEEAASPDRRHLGVA